MLKALLDANVLRLAAAEKVLKGPLVNSGFGKLQEFHVVDLVPSGTFLREQVRYLWGIARRPESTPIEFYLCELVEREYMTLRGSFGGNRGLTGYFPAKRISSGLLVGGRFSNNSITASMHMNLNAHQNERFSEIRDAFGNDNCVDAALLYCAEVHELDCVLTCDKKFRGLYSHNKNVLGLRPAVVFPKELAARCRIPPLDRLRDRGDTFPDKFWRNVEQ